MFLIIRILFSFFSLEVRHAPLKFHEDVQWNRRMKNRETRGTRVGDGASIGCAIHRSVPLPRLAPKINVHVDSISGCKPK